MKQGVETSVPEFSGILPLRIFPDFRQIKTVEEAHKCACSCV